jgi:hypothetical protein
MYQILVKKEERNPTKIDSYLCTMSETYSYYDWFRPKGIVYPPTKPVNCSFSYGLFVQSKIESVEIGPAMLLSEYEILNAGNWKLAVLRRWCTQGLAHRPTLRALWLGLVPMGIYLLPGATDSNADWFERYDDLEGAICPLILFAPKTRYHINNWPKQNPELYDIESIWGI